MADKDLLTGDDEDEKPLGEELVITEEDPSKKPAVKAEDHDEDDEDDERLSSSNDQGGAEDKEREAIQERRRLERQERKERREKAIARDKLELEFLSKRNAELERRLNSVEQRQHSVDVSMVDQRLTEALGEIEMAEKVIAKAVAAGNGDDVAQALRYRDQAMAKAQQLKAAKERTPAPGPAPQQADDRTLHYAQEFVKEHKWYDPKGQDEDSAIVLAIDSALMRDGYNPQTPEYWAELKRRAARRLPERFAPAADITTAADKADRPTRGGPALGGGKEHAPTSTRKEVYISPERKQALVDAGVWEDSVLRMKYVKRYAEYDRLNKSKS